MSAAALAVGIATSNAQVYSQNIVGYVSVPASSLTMLAPALDLDGTGTNNTVSTIFTSPKIGDTLYVFNGGTFSTVSYSVVSSGHGTAETYATNWYNGVTAAPNFSINPGQGFFYQPAASETNVMVGQVLQGTNLVNSAFPPANTLNIVGSVAPESGGISSVLDYNPSIGDTVYTYSGGTYTSYSYTVVSSGHGTAETYATNWYNGVVQQQPVISAAQGFWIKPAVNTNWVENFVVNP